MRALLLSAIATLCFAGSAMAQTSAFSDNTKLLELIKSRVDDGRATGLVGPGLRDDVQPLPGDAAGEGVPQVAHFLFG